MKEKVLATRIAATKWTADDLAITASLSAEAPEGFDITKAAVDVLAWDAKSRTVTVTIRVPRDR